MDTSQKAPLTGAPAKHVPGEVGIWVLIFWDMFVFSMLFVNYAWFRTQTDNGHIGGLTSHDQAVGAFNTVVLLTSSWCVAEAMAAARNHRFDNGKKWLVGAWLLGVTFLVVKGVEYHAKFSSGVTPMTNEFYSYFFVLTGLHALHVTVGVGVLVWMFSRMRPASAEVGFRGLECGASFWHMVDLLWILIFPLLYFM